MIHITNNRTPKTTPFTQLAEGDTFLLNNVLYQKIRTINGGGGTINAVTWRNGILCTFSLPDTQVIPVDVDVVIK